MSNPTKRSAPEQPSGVAQSAGQLMLVSSGPQKPSLQTSVIGHGDHATRSVSCAPTDAALLPLSDVTRGAPAASSTTTEGDAPAGLGLAGKRWMYCPPRLVGALPSPHVSLVCTTVLVPSLASPRMGS